MLSVASVTRLFSSLLPSEHASSPRLPSELVDRIIDYLHDDKRSLLALGLASKLTLTRSRIHIFAPAVEFNDDKQFATFLGLFNVPWTSFGHIIKSLHLRDMFPRVSRQKYGDTARIATHLHSLKTLRLSEMSWLLIPQPIRDLFFHLELEELQLDYVMLMTASRPDLVEIFSRLPRSIQALSLTDIGSNDDELPDLAPYAADFSKAVHLKVIDSTALLHFKDVWDPARSNVRVTVDAFTLRLADRSLGDLDPYIPFISRFLKVVGPSIQHLSFKISDPYPDRGALQVYESDALELSHLPSLRSLETGPYNLDVDVSVSSQLQTLWIVLGKLAASSPLLEHVRFICRTFGEDAGLSVVALEQYDWVTFVKQFRAVLPQLKAITIGVGYYVKDREDPELFIQAVRRAPGVRDLEKEGLSVTAIAWSSYGMPLDRVSQWWSGI